MHYSKLVSVYELLEKTAARLQKIDQIAELLKDAETEILPKVSLLIQGRVFPSWDERVIGVAKKLVVKVIEQTTGFSEQDIVTKYNKIGDLGLVVEELVSKKRQRTFLQKQLTVDHVFDNLQKVASIEGEGSVERKVSLISELLTNAKPNEAKYIVRTVLEELRVGVAEGVLRDSIGKAFAVSPVDVENAWFILPDYGEIAKIAKAKGEKGLKNVEIELGTPINVLLAEKAPSLEDALQTFENVALEFKFDGARCLIHKKGNKIWLFTRRLEDVTHAFPDIVELVKKNVKADNCILDSEAVGLDPKTSKPVPFQFLSTRIKRKYDIEKAVEQIPVKVNLFDIVYLDGKSLFEIPLKDRYLLLKKAIKTTENFRLADHLETKDLKEAEKFYKKSLNEGNEGLIVKNLDAKYQPGRHVGYWLKIKPTMENLDLVIVGGVHGTGKRTGWIGSLILGCRDEKTGEFLECGMLGTGIKEKKEQESDLTLDELTKMLKPLITSEKGNEVKVEPKIVIEVAYEEIQKSPTYSSGYALRFPRFIRLREDKGSKQADNTKRLETLFNQQKKRS
ncbi:MAG: ATP-dependent DNA ligase [Candidatus Aenigmarchaeota archaeon]|nr:ATP-dependent DNA ligase [Candidatus Aenigmarchaeota archaeon]